VFFTRVIKRNQYLNQLAIYFLNIFIFVIRLFVIAKKRNNDNIVIIALHRLGDSVFTIPAISNIINYHKHNIFIICYPEIKPIYSLTFKSINYVELKHEDFFYNHRIAKSYARKKLKKLKAQIIYDMTGDITSASLILTDSAKEKIGINEPYYQNIYTRFNGIRKPPHLVDNYIDGIKNIFQIKKFAPDVIKESKENYKIIIHPFASSRSKQWGLANFIKLVQILSINYDCALVSPPQMIPSDIKEEIYKYGVEIYETKNTVELIEVIRKGSFLIGNDSGTVQIADLLGIPTFTIYGPTNPKYHTPKYSHNEYILRRLVCSSKYDEKWCFTHGGVFCPSNECMIGLSFAQVKKSVLSMIENLKNDGDILY
jgi:ADP-heptose:LPS heptosyltransferase